jgi:hypothetical protein
MLIYVAGKYKGEDEAEKMANIGLAKQAAIDLWNRGHATICPHLNTMDFEYYTKLSNRDFVALDLLIVEKVDGIVMLPGWEDSRGACIELDHAKKNNIPVWEYPQMPPFPPNWQSFGWTVDMNFAETKGDD